MFWCGLDIVGIKIIDTILDKAPTWTPGFRAMFNRTCAYKISELDGHIGTAQDAATAAEKEVYKAAVAYKKVLQDEKDVMDRLTKPQRAARATSTEFNDIFLPRVRRLYTELQAEKAMRARWEMLAEEYRGTRLKIRTARAKAAINTVRSDVEAVFGAYKRLAGDESTQALVGDNMGTHELDFTLGMAEADSQNPASAIDDAFKTEIINILTGATPIPEPPAPVAQEATVPVTEWSSATVGVGDINGTRSGKGAPPTLAQVQGAEMF